ncbi:MAG: bifunctional oligoribonuclease/PAP phosphatase NrnA [Lachnospiraceae bacterium]|nr:bifunctional oligoribonuclease/PAP phosphatase NrnA [Lachnospiraceae bacterium]
MINVLEECKGANVIGISGHVRPDGDCTGSVSALYQYLKKALPDVQIELLLEKPSAVFADLPGYERMGRSFAKQTEFDVFFILDSTQERIGFAEAHAKKAKKRINIDHHISNPGTECDVNYVVPEASSTAELVYELIGKENLDAQIAKSIYIGMIHDTGVFQYSNTSPKTLRIAAQLLEYGFDFPKLIDETFYEKTYVQNQILGRALLESILFMDGKCIASMVDRKLMDFYQADSKDFEGIVNQLRVVKGVECAIFMYETGTLEYKVSLRSCGAVDVSKVAEYFGGGGHVRAAGCMLSGTYHDVLNNLSREIAKQMPGFQV